MRPVADLTRRRLGERLPLDPTESIAEFAAYAAHRRDMFFAAQTARRLQEMSDFQLLVPQPYRHYSTGRCVTFEAPGRARVAGLLAIPGSIGCARAAGPRGGHLPRRPRARAIRRGRLDRRSLARRPHGGVFLDPERLRGLAEVLAGVRRGDVDGIVPPSRSPGASSLATTPSPARAAGDSGLSRRTAVARALAAGGSGRRARSPSGRGEAEARTSK